MFEKAGPKAGLFDFRERWILVRKMEDFNAEIAEFACAYAESYNDEIVQHLSSK